MIWGDLVVRVYVSLTSISPCQGHGYGYGFLLPADRLPAPNTSSTAFCNGHQPNDSGFSSRIWEDPAAFTQREVQIEELNKAVAIVARGDDPDNDDGNNGA